MKAAALTARLKQRARDEGFDAVGVANATELERDGGTLAAWLRNDNHAGMAWMARDPAKRADPRRLLAGCRSVIAVAADYWPGTEVARTAAGRAKVALYARGRDYHKVLGKRLRSLAAWLEEESGRPARAFVDTGPVLERAWAERAGIGWIGKNANLLTRNLGSWILLGEILSAADLEADAGPHPDHCGSCSACIEACPTEAIVADGTIDADLCISYWTIEHRGEIPRDRRNGWQDWIFGCDICQEVCPWNRRARPPGPAPLLPPREDLQGLDPLQILELDEASFRARYSGTSLMRAKWEGMRRNACVVLGERGDSRALGALGRVLLEDEDPVVRGHACWAVGRIGGRRAGQLLRGAERTENDEEVIREIREALHGL